MTLVETLRNYPGDDNEFYKELGQKIYERLLEKTAWKSIRFSFREETTDVTCSKLGGIPFIPADGEYPVDRFTKEKLFFLFQINFAEMPHLDPYLSNGILQIFISGKDLRIIFFISSTPKYSLILIIKYLGKYPM